MERVKQSDILDGCISDLKEVLAILKTLSNLMIDNEAGIRSIDALDILLIFRMLGRELNDVADAIDDASYEIRQRGL